MTGYDELFWATQWWSPSKNKAQLRDSKNQRISGKLVAN